MCGCDRVSAQSGLNPPPPRSGCCVCSGMQLPERGCGGNRQAEVGIRSISRFGILKRKIPESIEILEEYSQFPVCCFISCGEQGLQTAPQKWVFPSGDRQLDSGFSMASARCLHWQRLYFYRVPIIGTAHYATPKGDFLFELLGPSLPPNGLGNRIQRLKKRSQPVGRVITSPWCAGEGGIPI